MNVLTHAASSRLFVVHLFVFGSGSVIRSTMLLSTEHVMSTAGAATIAAIVISKEMVYAREGGT